MLLIFGGKFFKSVSPMFAYEAYQVDNPLALSVELYNNSTAWFSDELFEGSSHEFEIMIDPYISESTDTFFMLSISVVHTDLFAYERTFGLHTAYTSFPALMAPVDVYSNIHNGLGIFAGYTTHSYRFDSEGNTWSDDDVGLNAEVQNCHDYSVIQ